MSALLWFVIIAVLAGIGWALARWRRQWAERQRITEERLASFVAQAKPLAPTMAAAAPAATRSAAAPATVAPQERLLLDAAAKAGEAGEPVLSIQLYAKLLSRYPQTQFAGQARAGVEAQKKKLAHS